MTESIIIDVYICPTPGCPDYFGAGGMGDLSASLQGNRGQNGERFPADRHHTRADCPTCRALGFGRVERVLVPIGIERPNPIPTSALPTH